MSGIVGSKLNIRGSGLVAKLGTDGQVFTSSGAGVSQAFEAAGGGDDTYIYHTQALGANETFEHTGKFVMEATDHLSIITGDSSDIDVCVSYLLQTL